MKRLFAILVLCSTSCFAVNSPRVTLSSTTCTNETAYIAGTALMGVDIGAASSGGVLVVRNSTFTATSVLVSSITLGTVGSHWYGDDGIALKGIYYTTTVNSGCVTILYHK